MASHSPVPTEEDFDDEDIQMLFHELSATLDSSQSPPYDQTRSLDFLRSDPVVLSLFHCTLCQAPFGDGDSLARHLLRRHHGAEADMNSYQLYFCQPCQYSFLDLDEVGRHAGKVHRVEDLRGCLVKVRIQRVERREATRSEIGVPVSDNCSDDDEEFYGFADQFLEQEMAEVGDDQEMCHSLPKKAVSANQSVNPSNFNADPMPVGRYVLDTPGARRLGFKTRRQNSDSGFRIVSPSGLSYEEEVNSPVSRKNTTASASPGLNSSSFWSNVQQPFQNSSWSSNTEFIRRISASSSQASPTPTVDKEGGGSRSRNKQWHNHKERGRRMTLRASFLDLRAKVFNEPEIDPRCVCMTENSCQVCATNKKVHGSKVRILEGAKELVLRLNQEAVDLETTRLNLSKLNSRLIIQLRQYGVDDGMLKRMYGDEGGPTIKNMPDDNSTRIDRRSNMHGFDQRSPKKKISLGDRFQFSYGSGKEQTALMERFINESRLDENKQLFHSVLKQVSPPDDRNRMKMMPGLWKDPKLRLLEGDSGVRGWSRVEDSDQDSVCLVVDEDQRSEDEEETIYVIEED